MRKIVSSILIITLAGVASANESFLRLLDEAPKNGTQGKRNPPPKKYDDDLKGLISESILDAVLASEVDISFAFQMQKVQTLQHGVQAKRLFVARMPLVLK